MPDLHNQRILNRELSEFISELDKLQKRHLEQVQLIEKLPNDHYQLSEATSELWAIEQAITDTYNKWEEEH